MEISCADFFSKKRREKGEWQGMAREGKESASERLLLKSTWHVGKIAGRWSLRCERSAIPNHFWALLDDVLNYKGRSNPPTIRVGPRNSLRGSWPSYHRNKSELPRVSNSPKHTRSSRETIVSPSGYIFFLQRETEKYDRFCRFDRPSTDSPAREKNHLRRFVFKGISRHPFFSIIFQSAGTREIFHIILP